MDSLKPSNNYRQHVYDSIWFKPGQKIPFKHDYATLKHMHDLRVWTLAFAPTTQGNMRRMQELHRINAEMWYYVSQAMWKRILGAIALWFFVNKIRKDRYMNNGPKDSHDGSLSDVSAMM